MKTRDIGLALMSGGLLILAFPRFGLDALAWVALAPLLHGLRGKGIGSAFLLGWITGLTFFFGQLYWVSSTLKVYGQVSTLVSGLTMLALVLYLSFYFAVFGAFMSMGEKRLQARSWLLAPLLWTSLEYLRGNVPSIGFPWGGLGYSQHQNLHLIQAADITGVMGITFAAALVNSAVARAMVCLAPGPETRRGAGRRLMPPLLVVTITLALLYAYGGWRLSRMENVTADRDSIRVAVVQGNIPQERKWDEENDVNTLEKYGSLTLQASEQGPRLIVWPETAVPFFFQREGEGRDAVLDTVRRAKTYVLFGSPSYAYEDGRMKYFNSAFMVAPDGREAGKYNKRRLVPFGEYVPLKWLFSFVDKIVEGQGEFSSGGEQPLLSAAGVPLGVLICFEVLFPNLARKQAKRGARLLVNITNDAWFGRTSAPYQHFNTGVFRAIENRIALVRAANTGISGYIAPSGRVLQRTAIFQDAWLIEDVALTAGNPTTYTRLGDLFAWGVIAFTVIAMVTPRANRADG